MNKNVKRDFDRAQIASELDRKGDQFYEGSTFPF